MPKADLREVYFDDVVQAYRWILGREPEIDALATQAPAGRDVRSLRLILLRSREFRTKFLESEIEAFCADSDLDFLPQNIPRLVFIHIPRSGGTSLHHILAEAVGPDKVCPARPNNLWFRLAADMARARLFSGHYDRNCIALIPGRTVKTVTMLRDPRGRLISVYNFLRAHRPEVIKANNLALAEAARKHTLSGFLSAAMEINPAAVDNTYLRTFGGRLPFGRWEQAAEPNAPRTLADFGCSPAELYERAAEFLRSMAAVGILERFEDSARVISRALELEEPTAFIALQSFAEITRRHENMEPVDAYSVSSTDEDHIAELTQYDMDLYKLGTHFLARSIALQAPKHGVAYERPNGQKDIGHQEPAAASSSCHSPRPIDEVVSKSPDGPPGLTAAADATRGR